VNIRWITPLLGTGPADELCDEHDFKLVDVRDMVDKAGNRPDAVLEKIRSGTRYLEDGIKVVICCDYGISRSNAIAAGILANHEKISLDEAVRKVQEATGETEIKLDPLNAVQRALEGEATVSRDDRKGMVLVTGAGGFLGSAICERLGEESGVIAPARSELDLEQGSIGLNLLAGKHGICCIIHLANPRVYTSNVALGKSLAMLRNVLDVCVSRDVALIFPSSWEVYSGYSGSLFVDESVPAFPRGPYGESKYLAELMIEHWRRTTALRCTVIRSGPVYGTGSDKPKFIYNFMEKARRGEPIATHYYRNGAPALDLLYFEDFVDAIVRAFRLGISGTFNIGTGISVSTLDIARMLATEMGSESRIKQVGIDATTARIAMNYERARHELGWQPRVDLQEGLRRVLA
jgi:UDP-glucuronate decarboxylase